MQPSWQAKLLSGKTPLPGALSMLLNIINQVPGSGDEYLAPASGPGGSDSDSSRSWENVLAFELAQQHTVNQLRKASKAMRQLELRGQLELPDSSQSTRYAPFDQPLSPLSTEGPDPDISRNDASDSGGAETEREAHLGKKKKKKSKKSKKSKKRKSRSAHSVGMGLGSAGGRAQGQRRAQTCYPEDSPNNAWANSPPPPGALQTVEISMGPLGDFTVHVYSDGFIVRSRTDGDALEISNVGHDLMFVRDSSEDGSVTVIGDISGQSISCSVTMRLDDERSRRGDVSKDPDPRSELWRKSCSIAAFGGSEAPREFLNYEDAQTRRKKVESNKVETFTPPHVLKSGSHRGEPTLVPHQVAHVDTLCNFPSPSSSSSADSLGDASSHNQGGSSETALRDSKAPSVGGFFEMVSSFLSNPTLLIEQVTENS